MGLYKSLENAYYSLMDKLEFLKVYEWFVNPIESRGIPSFPVAALVLIAVVAGAWLALGGAAWLQPTPTAKEWRVSVSGAAGEALPNALVTITIDGKEYSERTNDKGVALFKDLPANKTGRLTVIATGYEEGSQEFSTSKPSASIRLAPVGGPPAPSEKKIVVTVTSLRGEPLGDVQLTYVDPSTGETMRLTTDATGRAEIAFESEEDFFNVRATRDGFQSSRKTCFASVAYCEIELTSENQFCSGDDCPSPSGEPQELKGSVRVEVANGNGESVAARVTLYDADSVEPLSTGYSTASSAAFFESIAVLGASVYVVVEPESADYAAYNGGEANDLQAVSQETVFQVTLQPSGAVPETRVEFRVVGEDSAPVSGASLALYSLNNPLRAIAATTTGDDGAAGFDVAQDASASVYLAVSASGFLPRVERSVEVGTQKTIALTALVAGNNAAVRALVVDDDGAAQELARVFLVTADGFYAGVPPQETGADGATEFSGVPVDGEYAFRATLGARSGKSDFFAPAIDETVNATVVLEPETGVLRVSATDAASGEAIAAARFDAVLVDSNKTYASCTASAAGAAGAFNASANASYSCDLRVKAGRLFVVRAAAEDYAPAESEQLMLGANERAERGLKMVALRASRELKIIDFVLKPLGGGAGGVAGGGGSGDARQLDRGRVYQALLTVNFPGGADASGAFLRVGDKQSAADEPAVISFFEDDANASISWSSAWTSDAACVEDLARQEGEAKWVNWEYPRFFGTRTISAKVFVKPKARARDKVVVYYRAYSKKNEVVTRAPADDELGFKEKTADKDWCRAAAQSRAYAVVEGESECTDDACIAVEFATQDASVAQGDGFKAPVNSKFEARVVARSFTGASAATLRVAASAGDGALSLHEWSFSGTAGSAGGERSAQIPLRFDENGEASGTLLVKARLPSQQALLKFSVVEEGRAVLETQKFVVVEGLAQLALVDVSPLSLAVQTPAALSAVVKRVDDGSAVEDARLSLREIEGGGTPFDGLPNGDYAIQGDDASEGKGKEGRYVFKRVLATSPGVFEVVAEREGFAPAAVAVNVTAADFLEFSRDLSDLRFACEPLALEVSSALGLDAPVLASFNGAQCVALHAPGLVQKDQNTWAFDVRKGKPKKLELEPLRNGKCFLVFNSVLPASGGVSSATAWITVNCSKFEPEPSPVAMTNCTSDSCEKCGERDCLALNDSCEAKYARTPQGANVFVKCLQREKPKDKCDAAHCELCSEDECNALFATHNCSPVYSQPKNAFEQPVFVNCTKFKMPDCSPAKFNFKNILARRLAQYHARLLLDPQYKATQIGASAGTQITYDMAGLRVSRVGEGCEGVEGSRTVSCTKKINAIVPTNAMAFSLYNQFGSLGANFGARIVDGNKKKCFQLENADTNTSLAKIAALPGEIGAAVGIVPPLASHTWVLRFLPKKECLEYEWRDGRLFVEPAEDADSITLLISPFGNAQASVELTLDVKGSVDEEIAKYAFLFTPYNMYAGKTDDGKSDKTVPAAFFINNLQAGQKLVLYGENVTRQTEKTLGSTATEEVVSSLLGEDKPLPVYSQQVGVTIVNYKAEGDKALLLPIVVKANGEDAPGAVSLDPKASEGDAALKCSDDKCCDAAEYADARKQIEEEAKSVFGKILGDIETLYEGNIVDGNAALFKRALDDATADYLAQQGAYLVCKNLGFDPLAKLKDKCAEQTGSGMPPYAMDFGSNDLQNQGFGEIYGDSFLETACDSSVLNYAFGFGEAAAPGGAFMDVFKNRLTGALQPRSGTYQKKNYVVPVDIQLHAVLKRKADGKQKEGIDIYTVRPKDVTSPDGVGADGDWIDLEGPTLWKGLSQVQCLIGCSTQSVDVLTGCLAPFFGGVPEAEKLVAQRCKLSAGNAIQPKYDYCKDGVPTPSPSPSPSPSPPGGEQPKTPAVAPQPFAFPGWGGVGFEDALSCWQNGVYKTASGDAKCFDSLKVFGSVPVTDPTKLEAAMLITLLPAPNANDLFVPSAKYEALANAADKAKPFCFRTWFFEDASKTYFNPDPTKASLVPAGAKQKWVCTPIYAFSQNNPCVPLDDVYYLPTWTPTQCAKQVDDQMVRCKRSGSEYKCDYAGGTGSATGGGSARAASGAKASMRGEDCSRDASVCSAGSEPGLACVQATALHKLCVKPDSVENYGVCYASQECSASTTCANSLTVKCLPSRGGEQGVSECRCPSKLNEECFHNADCECEQQPIQTTGCKCASIMYPENVLRDECLWAESLAPNAPCTANEQCIGYAGGYTRCKKTGSRYACQSA